MKQVLKPKKIRVPGKNEPVLAILSYPGSGVVLPEGGAPRKMIGAQGGWWRRRIGEGACEIVSKPAKAPAKKSKKEQG